MYAIRTTSGFVIGSSQYGEAGKMLSIFTRDLGLVTAVASGVRLEKAKLRYHTQDYSFAIFSLVRGKEFWRLTSAGAAVEKTDEQMVERTKTKGSRELLARIALLLRRLLQGEDPNPELFECIQACVDFLAGDPELNVERLKTLESLTVIRMLERLGYIGSDAFLDDHIGHSALTPDILDMLAGHRTAMNRHINNALKESHL